MRGGAAVLFVVFLSSFVGSVLLMGPMIPFMILAPQVYRRVTDQIIGLWLALPVVSFRSFHLQASSFSHCNSSERYRAVALFRRTDFLKPYFSRY